MVPFPDGILLSFFFFLYYSKINKFITTAITFAHLTLASIWKKIWEACEILNLKHGSIFCWYSVVILFLSLLFQDQQIYYNGNNFCAFDASFDLKKWFEKLVAPIWKKIWEACEILNLKHGSISCWYSVVILFFLYYSKINKFITTAITFAHLTLASIWKKIWEACEILNLKLWFHFLLVFCCHFFFFSIIPRSTNLLQRQ